MPDIRLDLHVHAMLSKTIPFRMVDLELMINQARKRGLNGFALTEHLNARHYWKTYRSLKERFPYDRGIYFVDAHFRIINGAEISLGEAGHVVALGEPEAIWQIDKRLEINKGYRPTLAEVLSNAPEDLILIGAHPFRPNGGVMSYPVGQVKQLQALEINGKDFGIEDQVEYAANEIGLPMVAGSDAHLWPQIGVRSTVFKQDEITLSRIRSQIRERSVGVISSVDGPQMVDICTRYKHRIKTDRKRVRTATGSRKRGRLSIKGPNVAIQLSLA